MNLLLDTHTFLWYYSGSSELSSTALEAISADDNDFFISIASLWEITIKHSLGKLELDSPLNTFFSDVSFKGFNILPLSLSHLLQSAQLPFHHRDPFDRLLIAQAINESMVFITKDEILNAYSASGLQVLW